MKTGENKAKITQLHKVSQRWIRFLWFIA